MEFWSLSLRLSRKHFITSQGCIVSSSAQLLGFFSVYRVAIVFDLDLGTMRVSHLTSVVLTLKGRQSAGDVQSVQLYAVVFISSM